MFNNDGIDGKRSRALILRFLTVLNTKLVPCALNILYMCFIWLRPDFYQESESANTFAISLVGKKL